MADIAWKFMADNPVPTALFPENARTIHAAAREAVATRILVVEMEDDEDDDDGGASS